ncbi:methyltransferase family protein [Natronorubrum thiooxidans]|uniref:Protein-S-isoprenylcysteine O-methyltransferase Ste14 n=1 Tax=Natronorubrum thiooxidans TaxID=308853 RepID=A0A1N7EFD4_9EURY|nr:isoprenylcysteine carboxylmethyltransferase family protein [Natronorubrum thiooxidans]SIR86801.1 Protein-S-isoprenylcysteine O-methyltransferase Ste14 [Natronorubrum thiooxidans]
MALPLYSQPPYLYVFLGSIGLWVVSDLSIGVRHGGQSDTTQDRWSKHVIGGAVSGGALAAALGPELLSVPALPRPVGTFWLGIGLVFVGIAIRQYAVWTLGEYFSLEVDIDETDNVVTAGPYRWVRHPSYTGGFLSLVGLGVASGTWMGLGVVTGAGLLAYGYRIRVEERALRETLGESYDEYTNQTPHRLLPGLW